MDVLTVCLKFWNLWNMFVTSNFHKWNLKNLRRAKRNIHRRRYFLLKKRHLARQANSPTKVWGNNCFSLKIFKTMRDELKVKSETVNLLKIIVNILHLSHQKICIKAECSKSLNLGSRSLIRHIIRCLTAFLIIYVNSVNVMYLKIDS